MIGGHCRRCGECCRWVAFDLGTIYDADEMWVEAHHGHIKDGVIWFPVKCRFLTKGNKCAVHPKKPESCKIFPVYVPSKFVPEGCKYFEKE